MTAATSLHDRAYRRYDGPREGCLRRLLALFGSALRRALGLRRSWSAKLVPWSLILLAFVPAEIFLILRLTGVPTHSPSFTYDGYLEDLGLILLPLAATVSAELVCPERRENVLGLILTRPVTAGEYVAAKLGALATLLAAVTVGPLAIVFAVEVLGGHSPASSLGDHALDVARILTASAVLAVFFSAAALAIASFFARRSLAVVSVFAVFLVGAVVTESVAALDFAGSERVGLLDPAAAPYRVVDFLFDRPIAGHFGGATAVAAAALLTFGATAVAISRVRNATA